VIWQIIGIAVLLVLVYCIGWMGDTLLKRRRLARNLPSR
jgi:hypothetical protein